MTIRVTAWAAERFQEAIASPLPQIHLAGARAAYIGPSLDLAPHRNAAATLVIGMDANFELDLLDGSSARTSSTAIAVIPSGRLHHLRAEGRMIFLYLDAFSADLDVLAGADLNKARSRIVAAYGGAFDQLGVDSLCEELALGTRSPGDPRVATVIDAMKENPCAYASLAQAAGSVGLSSTRLQALFRAHVGMPFRRYRLWRRMEAVLRSVNKGETLTVAAYDAGFSSSAHLSATFKAMFGLTPSSLLRLGVTIRSA